MQAALPFCYCRWSPIAESTVFTSARRNQYCRHSSANHKRIHPTAFWRCWQALRPVRELPLPRFVQHNDMVSQTFFLQVCFCFFKGHFPTSPLLFGNGPDPRGQTGCAFDAGIRNDDHCTGRLHFIQICKHLHLQLVVVQNIALAGKVALFLRHRRGIGIQRFVAVGGGVAPPVLRCSFYSPLF